MLAQGKELISQLRKKATGAVGGSGGGKDLKYFTSTKKGA
jgi:hypothetical protein